jgi:hypothetical protein
MALMVITPKYCDKSLMSIFHIRKKNLGFTALGVNCQPPQLKKIPNGHAER